MQQTVKYLILGKVNIFDTFLLKTFKCIRLLTDKVRGLSTPLQWTHLIEWYNKD